MKEIFIFIFILMNIYAYEDNKLYLEIHKETNGDYIHSITLEEKQVDGYILNDTKLKLNFSAPRSDMMDANHYNLEYNKEMGFISRDWFMTFSLDLIYWFDENDKNIPEGLDFGNTFRIGLFY